MTQLVDAYSRWLSTSNVPKLFVNTDPGTILTGAQREVTVPGCHFIQRTRPSPTARTSTSSSASRKAVATVAATSSPSATSLSTTSFRKTAAVLTTSKICNCRADTATASKVTGRRNTW